MPHYPFTYFDEYPKAIENEKLINNFRGDDFNKFMEMDSYFDEHIKFRRFTIDKLLDILSNKKFNNTRIIITGDHGFRGKSKAAENMNQIIPHYTQKHRYFKIENVQDISYLINDSFAK